MYYVGLKHFMMPQSKPPYVNLAFRPCASTKNGAKSYENIFLLKIILILKTLCLRLKEQNTKKLKNNTLKKKREEKSDDLITDPLYITTTTKNINYYIYFYYEFKHILPIRSKSAVKHAVKPREKKIIISTI